MQLEVLNTLEKNDPQNRCQCVHLQEWFDYRSHVCMVSHSTQHLHLRPFLLLSAAGISTAQVKSYEQLKQDTILDQALLQGCAHMVSWLQSFKLPHHAVANKVLLL